MTGTMNMMLGGKTLPVLSAVLSSSTDTWSFVDSEYGPDYYICGPISITPTGGVSPYGYGWETISGDAVAFGSTASPFSATGAAAVLRGIVTDAAGQTAYTNNLTVSP